ncbi:MULTISPECIES: two-component system response regulator PgtA [Edwardsiella]|uniref:two-component system response regulator PgtA n=1 Tax=Edwardsiella TaxID=635 RepID=UPI000655FBAC|nr:sigma-54 dependent transcriptional regulator [Edwardsiella anguillarum]AKM48173.1 transcriptional regulator [Edwardsiella sp. EA181011]RFT04001.1 sigma-54-dependent Fis family transcriptional regulator [Edwardsiella anguillarum]
MLTSEHAILLIDDDPDVLDAYTLLLTQSGYTVHACADPLQALAMIPDDWPGVILSDVCMPGCSGIALMERLRIRDSQLPVLLITGHGDVPMAVEAVKKGARDFLQKPVDPAQLLALTQAALSERRSVVARRKWQRHQLQTELVGRSEWLRQMRTRLQQLAETDLAVYFYGEPGSGRTLCARHLHRLSARSEGAFIVHQAGDDDLQRSIDQAQGGTLLIPHPDRLDEGAQYSLVRSQSHDPHAFRLLAIGEGPLVEHAAAQRILPDLYYCFAMTQLACPPLSQRPDDIEPLFEHYLQQACLRLNHPRPTLPASLRKSLLQRHWANNVRELANAAQLFAVGVQPLADVACPQVHEASPTPLDRRVEEYERQIITEALNLHQGRINEVAEYLQIPRKKLYLRMKKYHLDKTHYR